MMRVASASVCLTVLSAFLLMAPSGAYAQGTPPTATTIMAAPVYPSRDVSQTPLRVAREGSVLLLLEATGDWCYVEFQDPEFGRRTGYVQTRHVRIDRNPGAGAPPPAGSAAQQVFPDEPQRSYSSGFFVGGGVEGNGIVSTEGGFSSTADSGAGFGLILGYGFNPRWSLYGNLSAAEMDSEGFGDTYGLGHFDIGTRIHFLAGRHRVVPFIQVGVSGRAVVADLLVASRSREYAASGAGVGFGGGLNAHFTPEFAFSAAATWSVGNFSRYEIDSVAVPGNSYSATSARVHIGVVWFPSTPNN